MDDPTKLMADALEAYLCAGHKDTRREASVQAKNALRAYYGSLNLSVPEEPRPGIPKIPGVIRRKIDSPHSLISRLIERDGWNCCWCGETCNPDTQPCADRFPTIEHVIRRADGGTGEMSNLKVACYKCNNQRHHEHWCSKTFQILSPVKRAIKQVTKVRVEKKVIPLLRSNDKFTAEFLKTNPVNFVYRDYRHGGIVILEFLGNDILEADKCLENQLGINPVKTPWVGCRMEVPLVQETEAEMRARNLQETVERARLKEEEAEQHKWVQMGLDTKRRLEALERKSTRPPSANWVGKFLRAHHKTLRIALPTQDQINARKTAWLAGTWKP